MWLALVSEGRVTRVMYRYFPMVRHAILPPLCKRCLYAGCVRVCVCKRCVYACVHTWCTYIACVMRVVTYTLQACTCVCHCMLATAGCELCNALLRVLVVELLRVCGWLLLIKFNNQWTRSHAHTASVCLLFGWPCGSFMEYQPRLVNFCYCE